MARLLAGAMSGTSADGVDVALVEIEGRGLGMSPRLVHHEHRPYDADLRRAIFALRESGAVALEALARCGRAISLAYAHAVRAAMEKESVPAAKIEAVAAHGQTLYHAPPNTIQWLDPALLAAEVGCPVVSDFRRADCAAGGQGAPLVPFADYLLCRHPRVDRVILNIGGIANVTCLPVGAAPDQVRAFDTGPGNCISDYLMREHDPAGPGIDQDGRRALEGTPVPELVEEMRRDPFFSLRGPKSTDGPSMIAAYRDARRRVGKRLALEDELATASAITTRAIVEEMWPFGKKFSGEVIVSGGGTRNRCIMRMLTESIDRVQPIEELGMRSEAKEAVAFALLGAATLDGVPSNLPSCTGARRAVVLGSITPRP